MSDHQKLLCNTYYHIYNRGVDKQDIFFDHENYRYFLNLYAKHVTPIADTYAYCLMKNHFHFLIRTKSVTEQLYTQTEDAPDSAAEIKFKEPSQQFSNLFNAYVKAINKSRKRRGPLFEGRFKRQVVDSPDYFRNLVVYIHRNPQLHGFTDDFRAWVYSSYSAILSQAHTRIKWDNVVEQFGSVEAFIEAHQVPLSEAMLDLLLEGDFYF